MSAGDLFRPTHRHDDTGFFAASLDPDIGPSRRFVVTTASGCGLVSLGAVVITSRPSVATGSALQTALSTAVLLLGLLVLHRSVRRGWALLTLAGSVGAMLWMSEHVIANPAGELPPGVCGGLGSLGVLGAGTWLVRIGAARTGTALITALIGARLFGSSLPANTAGIGDHELVYSGLALTAAAASVIAVLMMRATIRDADLAETVGSAPRWWFTVAGCVATLLVPLPLMLPHQVGQFPLLLAAVALSTLTGPRTLVAMIVVGSAAVAAQGATRWLATTPTIAQHAVWPGAAVGIMLGCATVIMSARPWTAAVSCGLAGLGLLAVSDRLVAVAPGLVANVLVMLLLAAATATAAVVARGVAERSAAVVVFGAILPVTTTNGVALVPSGKISVVAALVLCALGLALTAWCWSPWSTRAMKPPEDQEGP